MIVSERGGFSSVVTAEYKPAGRKSRKG